MIVRDVVVVGSGGAGMTAAVTAARQGLDVLLLEKTEFYGGTTALSGGGIWVPASGLAAEAGLADSAEAAERYVKTVVGPTLRGDLLEAFLEAAPKMVAYLQANTAVRFAVTPGFPDWNMEVDGASESGRLLSPLDYSGRALGPHFAQLRPPLAEFNAPGGLMFGLSDMVHIANATKSLASFTHIARLVGGFAVDRLSYPRGARLTMGNALAGRLLRSAVDAGVELWRNTPASGLVREDGRITGVEVIRDGDPLRVEARRGVILASGGFSADPEMRARYIPYAEHHVSLTAEGNTGDGLRMAMAAGATMEAENHSNAGWVVISLAKRPDGGVTKFPHLFLDRGKPGCIAVNSRGERFANEAAINMVEAMHASGSVPAHLICDHRFIRKYGLGLVRPGGIGLKALLASGYVLTAPTLAGLAARIGAGAAGLEATVARVNAQAAAGVDEDFGKGARSVDFAMGDPAHGPNPCLGPIEAPPFYAVKILPGDSTTTPGLRVDAAARVLDADDRPIPGLHAVGLDMNSLWRGRAPGNGANNTLSMTFGYLAAMNLAGADA